MKPHRSFLRSAAKLSYQDAQGVINGKALTGVSVIPEHEASAIEHDVRILEGLSKQMRIRRFHDGALAGDSYKLSFELDDNGLPVDCWQYERTAAHELVEEVNFYFKSGT